MGKIFPVLPVSLLFLVLLLPASCGPSISSESISEDILLISDRNVNMCAVRVGNELVVIDTLHSPAAAAKALKRIKKQYPRMPVMVVVNTHGHHDHTFGNQMFKGAEIYGHKNTAHWMKLSRELPGAAVNIEREAGFKLTPPEHTITKPEVAEAGGVKIFLIPFGNAHSSSDILVAIPSRKVLFVGDLFFSKGFPNFTHFRGNEWWPGEWEPAQWIQSFELAFSLGTYDHVVPGHGKSFSPERLKLWYEYFILLRKRVSILGREGVPVEEVVRRLGTESSFRKLFEGLEFPEFPHGNHRLFIREFFLAFSKNGLAE